MARRAFRIAAIGGGLLLFAAATTALCVYMWIRNSEPVAALPAPLEEYRNVELTDRSGSSHLLGELAPRGRVTVLSFWATWCVPCRLEARELGSLRRRYPPARLAIVYLNLDGPRQRAAVDEFMRANGAADLDYFYADAADFAAITGEAQVQLPKTFVYDRTGMPIASFNGFTTGSLHKDLERAAEEGLER